MSDFEYQRTLIIGAIIGASVCILGFSMMRPTQPVEAIEPKGDFKAVDTYTGRCDVVMYTDRSMATSKNCLDCSNK